MDYESYQKKYFTDPPPAARFEFRGDFGVTLFYEDYQPAVAYYEQVLGSPAYVEGAGTRGWRISNGWLTLLQGQAGNPRNLEVTFVVSTPAQAETLQQALIDAGGQGEAPSDQLMYEPIRYRPVVDPLGVSLLVISPLAE
jgi:hypothetical protein